MKFPCNLKIVFLVPKLIAFGTMALGQDQPSEFLTQEFRNNWGLFTARAQDAYARGYTGQGVTIAIFDEPAQLDHPEFFGRVVFPNPLPQFPEPGFPIPFHGTHVMGIAAAARDGQGMMGVAYDASIVGIVGNAPEGYSMPDAETIIQDIIQSGANVLNISQGFPLRPAPYLDGARQVPNPDFRQIDFIPIAIGSIIEDAAGLTALAEEDIVLVISNGNNYELLSEQSKIPASVGMLPLITPQVSRDGILYRLIEGRDEDVDFNTPDSWAFVPSDDQRVEEIDLSHLAGAMITVAALDYHNDGQIAQFSNRCGAAAAWCITAPGVDIYSTYPIDRYASLSGTSMAAPMVSGGAALVRQAFPYMTARQVIEVLLTTATDLGSPEIYGQGLLNLDRATRGPMELGSSPIFPNVFSVDTAGHDSEWSNDISGAGGIAKSGAGVLRLSGRNTYTGGTSVLGGVLQVDGSIAASALSVAGGATLRGSGTVGTTEIEGVVAPGNSVGELMVDGDLRFAAGSVYDFEIGADQTADLISVTGDVLIDHRASFRVSAANGIEIGRSYTMLSATGEITGGFAVPSAPFTFVEFATEARADTLSLVARRNPVPMVDFARSENQRAVARAIDTQPNGTQPLTLVLANVEPKALPALFQGLSGEIYSSHQAALLGESVAFTRRLSSRINANSEMKDLVPRRDAIEASHASLTVWGQGYGNLGAFEQSAAAASMTVESRGYLLGAEWELESSTQVGAILGLSRTDSSTFNSQSKSNGYHTGIYGAAQFGSVKVSGGLLQSIYDNEIERLLPSGAGLVSANTSGRMTQAYVEASVSDESGPGAAFVPFVQFGQSWLHHDEFAENGSAAALSGRATDSSVGFAALGARVAHSWQANDVIWSVNTSATYHHNIGDLAPVTALAFSSGDPFFVEATPLAEDSLFLEMEFGALIKDTMQISLGYKAEIAGGIRNNAIVGSFAWRF